MNWSRLSTIFLSAVMAVAVIGYFVGLADGVPAPKGLNPHGMLDTYGHAPELAESSMNKILPAMRYDEIPDTALGPTRSFQALAQELPAVAYDLYADIQPDPAQKEASGKLRASRRAFNGAPPIIPHEVLNTSDGACYACHSNGMQLGQLRASAMSHAFLDNCTQCHAPPPPSPFVDIDSSVATTFVGLPAPTAGQRAFPGAPPTIPHSQWMRENCNACHAGPNGWPGMETTHPWRSNCTQCHAPSAKLDQAMPAEPVPMLPPLDVAQP